MKDYVDIYYYLFIHKNLINNDNLHKAIINTFTKRNSINYLNDYDKIIDAILINNKINELYMKYIKSNNIDDIPSLNTLFEEIRAVFKNIS